MKRKNLFLTIIMLTVIVSVANAKKKEQITSEIVLNNGSNVTGKVKDIKTAKVFCGFWGYHLYNIKAITSRSRNSRSHLLTS